MRCPCAYEGDRSGASDDGAGRGGATTLALEAGAGSVWEGSSGGAAGPGTRAAETGRRQAEASRRQRRAEAPRRSLALHTCE